MQFLNIPFLPELRKRWKGSIRLRHTVMLSVIVLLIMGIGSALVIYQQGKTIQKAVEARAIAFSRSFALIGAAAVLDNLFRIQEAMGQYIPPDILQLDVIDADYMIVAAKDPQRIGTVLSDEDWLPLSKTKSESVAYSRDANGEPILVIVEPLYDNRAPSFKEGNIGAWVRVVFSLTHVRQEELQAVRRMVLVTLALIVAGIIAVQLAQRQVTHVFRGIIGQLEGTLSTLSGSSGKGPMEAESAYLVARTVQPGEGELEYLTEAVAETTGLLKSRSEALRQSRELLQSVLDNATAVIYIKDTQGRYLLINRQYETLFHITREEVTGKTDHDLFPKEAADAFRANDLEVLRAGAPIKVEEVAPHDDGLHTYISLKFPLRDPEGKAYAVCGISTDITDRKRAEEALQALTVSLEQKVQERTSELAIARDQALEATRHKSEFMANMSHELRTPLNAVIGFSEVLLEQMFGDLNPKQDEYIQDILASGRHLLALINDILDLSKVEAGRMELELSTFDLPMLLENTCAMVQERAIRHGLHLTLDIDKHLAAFTADERKVKQTILNLLSNAVKFTPQGGTICLRARPDSGYVEISVSDTGIGITPEHQQKIFEEFYQAGDDSGRKREGTGLGLSLAKKFVELHGGKVWVKSEKGLGSTFTFTLPMRAPVEKTAAEREMGPVAQAKRPVVLVIEDDASAAKLLSIHLMEAGFNVEVANDGEAGFEKAQALQPAIITLDILMPGLDGWDLLARLKADQRTAPIPVVIVSIVDERGRGFALGAAEYLVKPVQPEELISAVRRVAQLKVSGHRKATILAIDDDPIVLELMDAALSPEGFAVLKAGGGVEGLRLAQERVPDLIVLDLLMPDVDGFEVLDELKHNSITADIPIVILTCKTLTREDKDRLNGKINHLMLKGEFSRTDLIAHLRSVLQSGSS